MQLLLCRHGETDVQGKTYIPGGEVSLNEADRRQASQLATVAVRHDIQAIFASPEKRAIETAQIIGKVSDIQPIVIDELRERDWGDWNGEPWSTIQAKLKDKTLNDRYTFVPPHGESWQQMDERLKQAVDEIMSKAKGNVMIVTHGGALRALIPTLKREELVRSLSYDFDNASVTSFLFSPPNTYTLLMENDTNPPEGIDMQFVVIGLDETDKDSPARHQAMLRQDHIAMGEKLLASRNFWYGAALLNDDGSMKGSLYVVSFHTEKDLHR